MRTYAWSISWIAIVCACGSTTPEGAAHPPASAAFTLLPARDTVGTAEPFSVRVTDASGVATPYEQVAFVVTGGQVSPATAVTDVRGEVTATWTLRSTPATDTIELRAGALSGPVIARTTTVAIGLPPASIQVGPGAYTLPLGARRTLLTFMSDMHVAALDRRGNVTELPATAFTASGTVRLSHDTIFTVAPGEGLLGIGFNTSPTAVVTAAVPVVVTP